MSSDEMHRAMGLFLLLEEEEEELLTICVAKKRNRDVDNLFLKRNTEGAFTILIERRLFGNETKFREYFRVSREIFEVVLNYISEDITKESYNRRKSPITAEEKLCITLRYLATGESFRSLAFQFRVHHSWISYIVKATLKSIVERMFHLYIPPPTEEKIKANASDFRDLWQYPNCCLAIDGKHVRIVCPNDSGSLYFNYKHFYSIVLLAAVDARNRFVAIDVGSYGREGDAGIFAKSNMGKNIIANKFNIPPPAFLPKTKILQPHVILGDEAFGLTTTVMKPYPKVQSCVNRTKTIYNYRHSRARRTTKNAFGVLCQYFRVFFTPIAINPETADNLVIACCILHNILRNAKIPYPQETVQGLIAEAPTENMMALASTYKRRSSAQAVQVRDSFRHYFCSAEGAVPWQNTHVARTT